MKTLINIVKAIAFLFSYFVITAITGLIFPVKTNLSPDASAFAALFLQLAVNSFFIIYLLKRLSLSGVRLIAVTALSVYGLQIFMTQIETWIFIKSFPLITPQWLFNIFVSNLISTLAITLVGYLMWKPVGGDNPPKVYHKVFREKQWKLLVLSVTYMIIYFLFGYFVAWQLESLRDFYRNTVVSIGNVELAFIQVGRGFLWLLFFLPVLLNLKGGKNERLIIISLMMALLPTILLLLPNPFMPFPIRMQHFIEVFLSNGLFGIITVILINHNSSKRIIGI